MGNKIVIKLAIFAVFLLKSKVFAGTATCEYNEVASRRITGYICKLTTDDSETVTEIVGNHLPGKSDDDVQFVSGKNVSMKTLTPIFCEKYKNIERLYIFESELENVEANSLKKCPKLQYLDISINKIKELPEGLLSENPELIIIKFSRNKLTTLPENTFENLPKLKSLFMYRNQISHLPSNIFKSNINLLTLQLYDNKLTSIDAAWFENLHSLERVSMEGNQITDLPKNAFVNLQKCSIIWLSDNNLTTIHADSFGVNENFTQLYVKNNQINAIDEKFIENTSIRKINMENNICSQEDVNNRFEFNEKFKKCFDNYRPREN